MLRRHVNDTKDELVGVQVMLNKVTNATGSSVSAHSAFRIMDAKISMVDAVAAVIDEHPADSGPYHSTLSLLSEIRNTCGTLKVLINQTDDWRGKN